MILTIGTTQNFDDNRQGDLPAIFHSPHICRYRLGILLALGAALLMGPGPAYARERPKVLVLNAYHKGFLWTDEITRGIEETLKGQGIELHVEYLDTKRQFDLVYQSLLNRLLAWKHSQNRYDLVITSDNNAVDYLANQGGQVFGSLPHVFCGVNYLTPAALDTLSLKTGAMSTGVNEKADIQGNISLIRALHPDCRRILILTDNTTTGQAVQKEAEKCRARASDGPAIDLVWDLTFPDLANTLESLTPGTVVLYTIVSRDRSGRFMEFDDSARFVADHSPVPVYAVWSFSLGFGIVGGYMVNGYQQGRAAAIKALKILEGTPVQEIPVLWETPVRPMFDFRQLRRFGLALDRLPRDSVVYHRPTSLYLRHKQLIWKVAAAFAVLALALAAALYGLVRARRSEKALFESKERFLRLFHHSPVLLILSTVAEGRCVEANQAFCQTTGYAREEIVGKRTVDLGLWIAPQERPGILSLLDTREKIDAIPFQFRMRDGSTRDFLWSAVAMDQNGEHCALSTLVDVTETEQARKERDQLTEQLHHAQKMEAIGTLAGGIAHDFNNILSGIFGYAQLAQTHLDRPEKTRTYIDQILKGGRRAADLTRQILTFSRRAEYRKKPFKIYLEVNEVLKLLRSTLPATIEIKKHLETRAMVQADPIKIHQVVMNLCTNAYHAMKEAGGILTVCLSDADVGTPVETRGRQMPPGSYVCLTVRDTGQGMAETVLERAFDPYYTTKEAGQGTGLGLSLVMAIIEEHDAFMVVDSAPGQGTCFDIYFPRATGEEAAIAPQSSPGPELRGSEILMVVDDEAPIREVFQASLTSHGYQVRLFENGAAALAAFKADPQGVDLVITDATMPRMTGACLAKALLEIRPDLPVILVTGYADRLPRDPALDMAIQKYLLKPVENTELLVTVREILNKRTPRT